MRMEGAAEAKRRPACSVPEPDDADGGSSRSEAEASPDHSKGRVAVLSCRDSLAFVFQHV